MEGASQRGRRPKSSPAVRDDDSDTGPSRRRERRPATAAAAGRTLRSTTPLTEGLTSEAEQEAGGDTQSVSSAIGLASESSSLLYEEGSNNGAMFDVSELKPLHEDREPPAEDPPPYTADYSYIQHLLELTEGETDFESDEEIPDIFAKAEQLQRYSDISQLKDGLRGEEQGPYVDEFDSQVQDDALMVGKLSLEEIEAEEQRLQSEYLAYQEQEAARHREQQTEIVRRENRAKREVKRTLRQRERAVKKREGRAVQSSMSDKKQVYGAFHKAEQQMIAALKARKGEVKLLYGHLERADGYYGAVRGRRWKVDWTRAPQPVQIKIKTLRGVRDKLPASRYVLLVSLYDCLGGHVLRWSKLKGQEWGAASLPLDHQGHFYNTDMKFDQSVFTVLPSKPDVRPSMVLVFELFVLRGAATPTDRVVGWGAFPVCDANFNIIEGKYKSPLLRGPVDPTITKHSQMEKVVTSDLENWLCNVYFEVVKLPRYLQGMHEYEVELQFSSGLLGQPDRSHDQRGVVDGNEPVFGTEDDVTNEPLATPISDDSVSNNSLDTSTLSHPSTPSHYHHSTPTHLHSSTAMAFTPAAIEHALSSRLSKHRHQSDDSSDAESSSGDDGSGFVAVTDKPGLYYKVHTLNPHEKRQRHLQTLYPATPLLQSKRGRRRRKALSPTEDLEQHSMAVRPPFSEKGRVKHSVHERVQYVGRQLLSEVGLSQWRSLGFWSMVVILVLGWWVRLYLHYVAQYAFLRAVSIPVTRFEFYPHTVVLNYQSTLPFTREEVGVVVVGPLFNTLLFSLLILLSWTVQRLFGGFPDLGSLFIAAFGIQVLLDPYWVLLVDMLLLRYRAPQPVSQTADVTKLYWHFVRSENNGIVGIFLTLYLYILTTFTTLVCFYMYFLRVHMNGRLIDVYQRLKCPQEKFFFPHDLEISIEELGYICRRAEQWRGAEGERRKIAIYDYLWDRDELDEGVQQSGKSVRERTTHLSIHTLHLDGLRELYRHFLRLDNGAIIELFGEVSSVPGVAAGIKNALLKRAWPKHTARKNKDGEELQPIATEPLESTPVKRVSESSLHSRWSPIPGRSDSGSPLMEKKGGQLLLSEFEDSLDNTTPYDQFSTPYSSFNNPPPMSGHHSSQLVATPGSRAFPSPAAGPSSKLGYSGDWSLLSTHSANLSTSTALDFGDWDSDSVFERKESSTTPLLLPEDQAEGGETSRREGKTGRGKEKWSTGKDSSSTSSPEKTLGKQLSAGQLV